MSKKTSKWILQTIGHEFDFIENEEFKKLIEEIAEITYNDFCQLPTDSFLCISNNENKTLKEVA